jgi:hypothetical protein
MTIPDFFKYCMSIGKDVISAYETGGKAYIEDKHGNKKPILRPGASEDYSKEE